MMSFPLSCCDIEALRLAGLPSLNGVLRVGPGQGFTQPHTFQRGTRDTRPTRDHGKFQILTVS
jgi:hypothetical protein